MSDLTSALRTSSRKFCHPLALAHFHPSLHTPHPRSPYLTLFCHDASSTSPPAPFTSGVDAGSPSVPFSGAPSPDDLGRSKSRMKNLKTAEAFLNKFLSSKSQHDQQFRNNPYPNHLSLLTEEHLAAEHLPRFLSHCGLCCPITNSKLDRNPTYSLLKSSPSILRVGR